MESDVQPWSASIHVNHEDYRGSWVLLKEEALMQAMNGLRHDSGVPLRLEGVFRMFQPELRR